MEKMDNSKVSLTFPQIGPPNIQRQNMILRIRQMLSSDAEVVVVEGPEGIGKTTLLAQFAQHLPHHTFGLFIRSCSRWAYDSAMLTRDLCDQIGWALKKEKYRNDQDIDPAQLFRGRIFDLQGKAYSEGAIYYFVVDGIGEIPDEDCNERDMILSLLPFGLPRFRFVLSGPLECLKNRPQKIQRIKEFQLAGFTFEEAREFFSDLTLNQPALESIYKITNTSPGNMASVRRLLLSGVSVDRLLEDLPENPPDWFDLEWRVVEKNDALLSNALAILAFDRRQHSVASLAKLCKTEPDILNEKLTSCSFIKRKDDGKEVEFVCDVFAKYAANRLASHRRTALDIVISDLLESPESTDALLYLPNYLYQASRFEDILNYLSPQHIGNLIDCGDSWLPVHQKAEIGLDAALRMERDGDLFRFSLQGSVIASLEHSEPWRSQIEAYVALNDFAAAYALAERMVTKEHRLHLMAAIARAKRIQNLPVEIELSDQIQQLYRSVDASSLGERGVEIAADLLFTQPEMAVELVQQCMKKEGSEERLDLALANLSLKAMMKRESTLEGVETTRQLLRARVKDPALQKFLDMTSIAFGRYNAEGVIAEVEKWEKGSDRLFGLKAWTASNVKREDAAIVIEYALDTILRTSTYTTNAKVYRELLMPLVFISDLEQVKKLIGRIDELREPIESTGPTLEYVKLLSILVEAEARYDLQASFNRLEYLFTHIDDQSEPATKLACFAVLVEVLKKIDKNKAFEEQGPIHALALQGLQDAIHDVLNKTADHYKAVGRAIGALARSDINIALAVIEKLNTSSRREAALIKLIEATAIETPSEQNFVTIVNARGKIKSILLRAQATGVTLQKLLTRKQELTPFLTQVLSLRQWVQEIPDAEERCEALCKLIELLFEFNDTVSPSAFDPLFQDLEKAWNSIACGWARVDMGFQIASLMAKMFPNLSRDFLKNTETLRNEIVLGCHDTAASYISCVQLTLRCFIGLLKRRSYNEDDLEAINQLVNRIPSPEIQVIAWNELALNLYLLDDLTSCRDIVAKRVRFILTDEYIPDDEARWKIISLVAPALHCAHNVSAKQIIDSLPQPYKDNAVGNICRFLISHQIPIQSYDPAVKPDKRINFEEFLEIYQLLETLEADHRLYWTLESLIEVIYAKSWREFNKSQKVDIIHKIRNLIASKFPNPHYIKHEGYKILAEAQINRLDRDYGDWEELSSRARAIQNVPDKALVLLGIGAAMPGKERPKALELMKEAKSLIPDVASLIERIDLYEELARVTADLDRRFSKECLRAAWHETVPLDPSDMQKVRRNLIDFAHRLDPDFAASLASESEEDTGREFARERVRQRLELLKCREQLKVGKKDVLDDGQNVRQQVEFAQMLLASLNSKRLIAVNFNQTRSFIKQASHMELEDAIVLLLWVIQNAVFRYSNTDRAETLIRGLYEAARLSAELTFRIAMRIESLTDSSITFARNSGSHGLVTSGKKEKALKLLEEWSAEANEFVKITDPYFGPEQLEFVKLIRSVNSNIPIYIITSHKHQHDIRVQEPLSDSYRSHWRLSVSDSDPGEVWIIIIGRSFQGEHPIHDRWWLCRNNGLRLGTSLNAIGIGRLSEISRLNEAEALACLAEVDRYTTGSLPNLRNEQINFYSSFRL